MKPQHVLDQLPLWVEGDLPDRESDSIQDHLTACESCSAAAQALRASQAWLRSAPPAPFDDVDRSRLRREVMAWIRVATPKAATPFRTRPLFLTTAASALFFLATSLYLRRSKGVVPPEPPARPSVASLKPPNSPRPAIQVVAPQLARPSRPARKADPPASAESTFTRLEFQTSNPQIRIIWLARAQAPPRSPADSANPI